MLKEWCACIVRRILSFVLAKRPYHGVREAVDEEVVPIDVVQPHPLARQLESLGDQLSVANLLLTLAQNMKERHTIDRP